MYESFLDYKTKMHLLWRKFRKIPPKIIKKENKIKVVQPSSNDQHKPSMYFPQIFLFDIIFYLVPNFLLTQLLNVYQNTRFQQLYNISSYRSEVASVWPVFKQSLLERCYTHSLHIAYGCFHTAAAKLSHCSGDHKACKYLLFSPLQKKFASCTRCTDVQERVFSIPL